jgi:DNA-binding NarL/FixJ family response regulator
MLMDLLASGLTDENAAIRLGWTRWTLRRRLRKVMDKLSARSRLQAGYLFAQLPRKTLHANGDHG